MFVKMVSRLDAAVRRNRLARGSAGVVSLLGGILRCFQDALQPVHDFFPRAHQGIEQVDAVRPAGVLAQLAERRCGSLQCLRGGRGVGVAPGGDEE